MHRLMLAVVAPLFVALAGWAPAVLAHTKLAASTPASGATVEAPAQIVLEFAEDVRLTAVELSDASGARIAVEAAPAEVASRFVLAIQGDLRPGSYSIAWRCVGADTHIVSGEIPFTVSGAGPN